MTLRERRKIRVLGKILFVLYVGFLIYFLIFSDLYGRPTDGMQEYHYNIVLFKEMKRFWKYRRQLGFPAMFTNLLGNVLLFVPFGFFMPMASRYRNFFSTLFWSGGLSLGVEIFQFFTRVGSFDVDDILLNTAGGIAGYMIFAVCAWIRRRNDKKTSRRGSR